MGTKLIDTVSTAQSVLPSWYTNTAQDILAQQQAIADRGYTPYGGARVADLTPDQLSGLEQARLAATGYQGQLDAARASANNIDLSGFGDAATSAGGIGALGAAADSLGTAQPWYAKAAGMSGLDAASPFLQRAAGMSATGAATPQLQQALGYTAQSTGPLGLAMAQPWLQRSQDTSADVSAYMNPYDDSVVQHLGELGARTLREQLAPAINDKFIQAGQLRSSGQSVDEARALRDVYSDTLAKQAELLQQGYTQAQAAKGADLSRFAGLAGTAGNLGFQQQGALSTAAGQTADIGRTLGQLTSADQAAQAGIGGQYGALTQAQQQLLASIGTNSASASQADTQAAIQAAQAQAQAQTAAASQAAQAQQAMAAQQAAIAQQQQSQGLAGAGALQQGGALTQAQNQKSLDQQYADFLAQQNFPQQQIDQSVKTFQGVQGGVPQGTVGYEQQVKAGQGASGAATLLAGLSAAHGVGVI